MIWVEHSHIIGKLVLGSITALVAFIADSTIEIKAWEDVSLKALLIVALIFIGKQFLAQQREHKADILALQTAHKAEMREALGDQKKELLIAMQANTKGMEKLSDLTEEQTTFYKGFTRQILEDRIKPKLPS